MNDTIRDRLELLLARIAGNDVDIKTMTPGVVTNLTEKFLMDIARRIDIIEQSGGVDPKLSKMLDVDITSPSDGQALVYNAEIEKWINEAIDDTYNLADMSDVRISSPSSDNILVYNSSSNKWENSGRINSIEAEISSVNSSLSWLNNRVIDAYDRIDDVEDRVSDLEDTDAELLSKIDAILSDLSYVETVASSAIGNEANAFDDAEGTSYSVGDYCIYDNKLYICKRRTSSPQFDNTAWERVNIGDKLKQIKAEIDTVATDALNALNNSNAALTAAASASTDASNAITYSSTAMSNASAAVSTANAALSSASDATDIATTADGNASNALNIANASNVRSQNAIKAIAATYNTSLTYNIGDYCTYNSFLYKCVSDETTGAWDENKWIKVTVGDELLSSIGTQSDWNETDISSSAYIKNKPSIPTVNDATLTIQKNSETVGSFTANASNNEIINITVPVNASDVSALPSSTKYGAGISVSINTTDYKVTTILKDQDGNTLGVPQVIDLPIESVVVGGSYDDVNKKIILTLQNGSTIDISVGDLVSGLQTEITVDNKLASDLIDDSNQSNKFITVAEKNKLLGIESGAEVNVQSDWNETVITSDAYIKNKPSIPSNTSDLTNDSDFVSDASYVHTDNNFTNTLKNKLNNIDAGAEVNVQSDWNETDSTSDAYIQNKPSIPSVGNGKLTIQRNGVTSGEFTANQNSNEIVDIAVPTKTSDITNDTNFVSDASYVHTDNNFTTTLKNKLDGIAAGAEVNVQADWNQSSSSSDAFIKNKPTIPSKTSDLTNDSDFVEDASYVHTDNNFTSTLKNKLDGIAEGAEVNVQSDWNVTDNSSSAYIKNKPSIPTKTSDLTNDSDFVEDASYVHTDNNFTTSLKNKLNGIETGAEVNVQSDWSQTTTTADDYIKNKPTIPTKTSDLTNDSNFVEDASYVHTDNNFTTTLKNKLDGIAAGAEVNVQADWNVTSSTSDAFIKNKPTIPDELADLSDDSTHRLVTDTEKAKWNATSVYKELIDEDLDNVLEVGFYVGKAGNTCANKPANVVQFGLQVVRLATDAVYYKQILTRPTSQPGDEYVRTCYNGTWQDWKKRADFSGSYDDLTNKPADAGSKLNPVYFSNGAPVAAGGNVVPYIEGTGTTAGTWTGTLTGLTAYYDGLLILYKTPVAGASTTTLNINGLGAKTIYTSGTTKLTTHFPINQPMLLVYSTDTDNGCWKAVDFYNSDTRPQAQCNTAAATAAKTADMTYYSLKDASYLMVNIRYTNTSASALTLNVNSTGAKDVYINGTISSASNYTLPAGSYLVYYKDSKYYFRTDGKITGDITGDAATVGGYTVGKNIPSNAVFTDRYVNSASFADDTSANASNPVKMTLTRSGSDSQTVVSNIPKVSSSTAGVVPKGATVSSQKQTTKFLREDGTWSAPSYTNNASQLTANGYLAYSPESARTIVPFINNDLAHLLLKGGSATLTCDNVLQTDGLTRIFDGSPSYFSKDNTGFSTAVFEITCNRSFNYSSVIYIDFGAPSFRAQSVKFEVINTDYANDTWETVYNNTANGESYCFVRTQHAPVGGAVSNGYNKIRITLSSFYTVSGSGFRVTQIGAIAYNSSGSMEVFLGKGGGYILGDVYPSTNNTLSVGRSTNYFANGYFTKINGVSPVLTDDKVKITEDTSTSDNFRVLLDTSHNNNTVTESVSKNRNLVYNPSAGVFYTPREVINTTDSNVPLIVRTDSRSAVPANGDDIAIFNGAFKKTVSGTTSTLYNSVISLIGNNASTNVGVVRFGSSNGATIITGGAGAKAFPKNFVNTDSSTGKYNSDGAIWLAAQSEVHIYTNASNSAAKFGGHIWMNQGGLRVDRTDASAGTLNNAYLIIGNNTAKSNAGAAKGTIQIWDRNSSGTAYSAKISPDTLTQERTITIPDKSGVIQLQPTWSLLDEVTFDGTTDRYDNITLPDGVKGLFVRIFCSPASERNVFVDGLFNDMTSYMRISQTEFDSSNSKVIAYSYAYTIGNGLWKFESTDATTMSAVSDFVMGQDVGLHTRVFSEGVDGRLISSDTKLRAIKIWFSGGGNFPSGSKLSIYIMQ